MSGNERSHSGTVALFNASDDTINMIRNLLIGSGAGQTLVSCHFADLKNGVVDFGMFIDRHNPDVVVFDLSPPYDENWRFFVTMRDSAPMRDRGMVVTTTNKKRLDEAVGGDSKAIEVVGRAKDLSEIADAIKAETRGA